MGKIVFITGGCRSGKSSYAQTLAESSGVVSVFIATCPSDLDGEMNAELKNTERKGERDGKILRNPRILGLQSVMRQWSMEADIILVDCLTLWINNLMYRAFMTDTAFTEKDVFSLCSDIIDVCGKIRSDVIFVQTRQEWVLFLKTIQQGLSGIFSAGVIR